MFRITRTTVLAAACSMAVAAFAIVPLANAQMTPANPPKSPGLSDPMAKPPAATADKDIIEVATGPGMTEVSTVVAAIKAADLVDTLKGPGPFTVFAPTNAAFDKLGKDKVAELLKPENKDKLKAILLYHVHSGDAVKAADVKTMSLSTANGAPLMVKVDGSNVMINDAKVIKTDVMAKNGIIHWVDTVLVPKDAHGDHAH